MIAEDAVDRWIDPAYLAASAAAAEYVRVQAARVLGALGYWRVADRSRPLHEIAALVGVTPAASAAFAWLAAEADPARLSSSADAGRRAARRGPPDEQECEQAERRLSDHAAIVGSSRAMLAYVAERYPSVLRGERSALAVLFKGPGLDLWESYFSASNPLYDVHNQLAAVGLRSAWPVVERPRRILELGTGTGGATTALLAALDDLPGGTDADFVISDLGPSFLLRVADRVRSRRPSLRSLKIDFDRSLDEQGLAPGTVDVIVATNALHASRDLPRTLALLRTALAPGGVLIVSESVCQAGGSVHQEFVFNLLGGIDPSNGRSRFLSSARWRELLEASGWSAQLQVNSRGPELAMLAVASPRPNVAAYTGAHLC